MSVPSRLRVPPARLRALAACLALGACARETARTTDAPPPAAEFLVAAGDSTYWVATGATGARLRASPLLLARWDGRLYEVYAADDDRSFHDAIFTAQRIYRRDLVTGDSLAVYEDATVTRLAGRYAADHPRERPLAPDEEAAAEPALEATQDVALLEVHGPYLSFEAHVDVDDARGRYPHHHAVRRGVIDLRTGRPATLDALFGVAAATSLAGEGRARFARALDSLRTMADGEADSTARRARAALRSLAWDATSFGLVATAARAPAVTFVATGADDGGRAVTLPLAPVGVATPAWWTRDVGDVVPRWSADSALATWRVGALEVLARRLDGGARLALRDGGATWPIGDVAGPVHQLLPLDRPPLPDSARAALRRAFNESALYDGNVTSARWAPRRRPPAVPRVRLVAQHPPRPSAPRARAGGARPVPRAHPRSATR